MDQEKSSKLKDRTSSFRIDDILLYNSKGKSKGNIDGNNAENANLTNSKFSLPNFVNLSPFFSSLSSSQPKFLPIFYNGKLLKAKLKNL